MLTKTSKQPKCKVCRAPFTRMHSFQNWCSPEHGAILGLQKLEKEKKAAALKERKETRVALEKYKKLPKLIADAQAAFNPFIRERDKDKGCFVCGRPFLPGVPGRVQHAGHVRSRGAAGHLRFNEDNCHGECEGCNNPKGGAKPHQIKAGAIARIGQERYDALEADNTVHKWTREELVAIKVLYQRKLKELRAAAQAKETA